MDVAPRLVPGKRGLPRPAWTLQPTRATLGGRFSNKGLSAGRGGLSTGRGGLSTGRGGRSSSGPLHDGRSLVSATATTAATAAFRYASLVAAAAAVLRVQLRVVPGVAVSLRVEGGGSEACVRVGVRVVQRVELALTVLPPPSVAAVGWWFQGFRV